MAQHIGNNPPDSGNLAVKLHSYGESPLFDDAS